ncbi:MAG TPA: DUF4097 family beta strand repeat-containing protein [Candidatus Elarobacter sp.]|jgi:hypothetical protein
MISRSTLLGALVVAELAIVGMAAKAVAGSSSPSIGLSSTGLPSGGFGLAAARTALDRSFVTGPAPHVVIEVPDIPVRIVADNGLAVHLVETVRKYGFAGEFEPATVRQTADGIHVSSPDTSQTIAFGSNCPELRLTVPANARVEITSGGGVEASGLRAKLIAHFADGRIELRNHRGDVDVSTGSGTIRLVDVTGSEIAASTRDGRVYLTRIAADHINASSASGRIVGADVRATDGALTTRDGRIILSFSANSDATVRAHTADGTVSVHGFSVTRDDQANTVFRVGSGRGAFELSTENGPISITQGASV